MMIGKINNFSFTGHAKLAIPPELREVHTEYGRKVMSDYDNAQSIAMKNNTAMIVGQDILILNSTPKIEQELREKGIGYEIVEDIPKGEE